MEQNFIGNNSKTIAIDFDGTIVEHQYPRIGKEMLFAFATIKELQKKGINYLDAGIVRFTKRDKKIFGKKY